MRQRIFNKICPIVILLVAFITAISLSIVYVHAEGGFVDNSNSWSNVNNSLHASPTGTYPYNVDASKITIKSVPLDILYGTSKGFGLIQYHGEVPYAQVYDSNGESKADGFGNKYARPGTTIASGSYNNPDGVSAIDYWGFDSSTTSLSSGTQSANLSEYEKLNDSKIISLRFYAMAHTTGGFGGAFVQFFSNLLYSFGVLLASLATMILSLIVDAKNIDMEEIMNMLNLQKLSDMMTNSFIFDSTAFSLSPFALFAIVMFIFALVAYGIKYAKGQDRETGLKDIIVTALTGVLIIGMCLSGKLVTLGSVAADLANQFIATAAAVSASGSGNAFATNITDKEHSNKVAQLSEMTLIDKTFIDMQICAQFGVPDIDYLKLENLGDVGHSIANTGQYQVSGQSYSVTNDGVGLLMKYVDTSSNNTGTIPTAESEFSGNLGYFYWFANSSASQKTIQNAKFPSTDANAVEDKLDAMITYLQAVYNRNLKLGNDSTAIARNGNIRHIILSLSLPNGASGFVPMLLLTVILVILGICLFKYCLNVVIGKLELFLSILGLAVAGPLMLTTNKKLVTTGKAIVGMIPVAFVEITVYSIIFDVIIYLTASLMSTNILQLLVVCALVFLLMKLNPVIQEKIKQLLNNATRAISPALSDAKRAVKTYTRQKANDFINNYDKSRKVVGYDKDGHEILQERGGNALSKLMHQGYNSIYNDGMQRETFRKINKQQSEVRDRNVSKSDEEKRRDAEAVINNVMTNIKDDALSLENQTRALEKDFKDQNYTVNGNETTYVEDNLTDEEKAKLGEITNVRAEIDSITNSSTYKKLMAEKNHIDAENNAHKNEEGYELKKFDEDKQQRLNKFIEQRDEKIRLANKLDNELKQSVDDRARDFALDKLGLDKNAEGKTKDEKLKNATMSKAQSKHADELHKALQDGINTIKDEVNTKHSAKIGSSSATVNRAAVASNAAMAYQMKQLQEGKIVSDSNAAKNETKGVVDAIVNKNDSHVGTNEVANAKKELKESKKVFHNKYHDADEREEAIENAKNNLTQAKQDKKDNKKAGKENYKETKAEYGRTGVTPLHIGATKATIAEQIDTMVKSGGVEQPESNVNQETTSKPIPNFANKPEVNSSASNTNSTQNDSSANNTSNTQQNASKSTDRWDRVTEEDASEAAAKVQNQNTTTQSQQGSTAQSNSQQQSSNNQQQQSTSQYSDNKHQNQSNTQNQTQYQTSKDSTNAQANSQVNASTNTSQTNTAKPNNSSSNAEQSNQQQSSNNSSSQQVNTSKPNLKIDVPPKYSTETTKPTNASNTQGTESSKQNTQSNTTRVKIEKPQSEAKADIEDVRSIRRDKADYAKDEGREYLANEELKSSTNNSSDNTSPKDFWSSRRG